MDMLSTELPAFRVRTSSVFSQLLQRLQRAWAIRRTKAAIADLTEDQLRDIGLVSGHPMMELDEHQRYWHRHLMRQ